MTEAVRSDVEHPLSDEHPWALTEVPLSLLTGFWEDTAASPSDPWTASDAIELMDACRDKHRLAAL